MRIFYADQELHLEFQQLMQDAIEQCQDISQRTRSFTEKAYLASTSISDSSRMLFALLIHPTTSSNCAKALRDAEINYSHIPGCLHIDLLTRTVLHLARLDALACPESELFVHQITTPYGIYKLVSCYPEKCINALTNFRVSDENQFDAIRELLKYCFRNTALNGECDPVLVHLISDQDFMTAHRDEFLESLNEDYFLPQEFHDYFGSLVPPTTTESVLDYISDFFLRLFGKCACDCATQDTSKPPYAMDTPDAGLEEAMSMDHTYSPTSHKEADGDWS